MSRDPADAAPADLDQMLDDGPTIADLWHPVPEAFIARSSHLAVVVHSPLPAVVELRYLDENGSSGGVTFDAGTALALRDLLDRAATDADRPTEALKPDDTTAE